MGKLQSRGFFISEYALSPENHGTAKTRGFFD
jgi:hypothetical protein